LREKEGIRKNVLGKGNGNMPSQEGKEEKKNKNPSGSSYTGGRKNSAVHYFIQYAAVTKRGPVDGRNAV